MITRKILFSLVTMFVVVAMMGVGTYAAFSSAASNTGNTFGAGTLTLKINDQVDSGSSPIFTLSNKKPGDVSDIQTLDLVNSGSLTGTVKLVSITTTPAAPNLGDVLKLDLYNDTNGNGSYDDGVDLIIHSENLTGAGWADLPMFTLTASESHKVFAKLTFDSDAGDTYQGQSVSFSFNFVANQ